MEPIPLNLPQTMFFWSELLRSKLRQERIPNIPCIYFLQLASLSEIVVLHTDG